MSCFFLSKAIIYIPIEKLCIAAFDSQAYFKANFKLCSNVYTKIIFFSFSILTFMTRTNLSILKYVINLYIKKVA